MKKQIFTLDELQLDTNASPFVLSIILLGRFLMLHSVTRISPICPRLSGRLFLSPITVWLAPLSKKRS